MRYLPELSISADPDGDFVLLAVTEVPSVAYSAGPACAGAPPSIIVPPGAIAVILPILSNTGVSVDLNSQAKVQHRLAGIDLKPGMMVRAYVTVDGAVHGRATAIVPSVDVASGAAGISIVDCLHLAIEATPFPENANSPDQQLHELGIVDDQQTRKHQNKVAVEMQKRGSSIDADAVASGPNVTIVNCGHSIFQNQRS